jgi:hypothetical protein
LPRKRYVLRGCWPRKWRKKRKIVRKLSCEGEKARKSAALLVSLKESSIICESSLVQQVGMMLQRIKLTQINECRITYASSAISHSKWQPKSSVELWKLPKVEWKCRKVGALLSSMAVARLLLWWRQRNSPWCLKFVHEKKNLSDYRAAVDKVFDFICLLSVSIAKFEDKQKIRLMHRFFSAFKAASDVFLTLSR